MLLPAGQGGKKMFFKPKLNRNLWDTFVYYHNNMYYLYYLVSDPTNLYGVCLATSKNGVHWDETGMVFAKSKDARWMATGAIMKSPTFEKDGVFRMSFSEWRGPEDDIGQQSLFTAESTNLIDWKPLGPKHEFRPDTRCYSTNSGNQSRWDGISAIPRAGGGYYGYWTANPKEFHPGFGFGESDDGVDWRALAPPPIQWDKRPRMGNIEVGSVERFGDTLYMMIGTWGQECYQGHTGMLTLVARDFQGPFHPAEKNFFLLTSTGHLNAYFTRFCRTPDGILVNHQSIPRHEDCYFGTLKLARVDDEGTLRLMYWMGNERLKGDFLDIIRPEAKEHHPLLVSFFDQSFDVQAGLILEGRLRLPHSKNSKPLGLHIECTNGHGTTILVGHRGITEYGTISNTESEFCCENRVDRELSLGTEVHFRLLLNHCILEFYLDDILSQCFSLPGRATGRIGLMDNSEKPAISNLRAWKASVRAD